jgi:hypothetical protein
LADNCFKDLSTVKNIILNNSSIDRIGTNCFSGCSALMGLSIPDTLEIIETDAFVGCTNMQTITYKGDFT